MPAPAGRRAATAWLAGFLITLPLPPAAADFLYRDFNETAGLRANGDATTTSCDGGAPFAYNAEHGVNDAVDTGSQLVWMEEGTDATSEQTSVTYEGGEDAAAVARFRAGFPHRDTVGQPPDPAGCALRLRLTPARPFKAGSVMRLEAAPVLGGFETGFSFQVTDASRHCTAVRDAAFSTASHTTCSITGGDGFAFVIHADGNTSAALGGGGGGLGYAGIRNGLAVEFDTLFNGGSGGGAPGGRGAGGGTESGGGAADADLIVDHVSLQGGATLTSGIDTRLGAPRPVPIGDGGLHSVRIVYWPYLKMDLVHAFTASRHGAAYLKDEGDARRVGTLAVYVDDMDAGRPVLATPLNLNTLLRLGGLEPAGGGANGNGQAFMGFTAATGRSWQVHDVTDWFFCEQPGCPYLRGDPTLTRYYE
jgi:hypothetical protein